jgi:hypothetical protein
LRKCTWAASEQQRLLPSCTSAKDAQPTIRRDQRYIVLSMVVVLTMCSQHISNEDLRSVLKLQPTNTEAMAELASLLPPDHSVSNLTSSPSPKSKIDRLSPQIAAPTPSQSPSSSSSRPTLSPANGPGPGVGTGLGSKSGNAEKQQPAAKTKQGKQLPFPRTKADDRKLKIVLIPVTAEEMALEANNCPTHHHRHDDMGKGKGKGKEKAIRSEKRKAKANLNVTESKKAEKSKWKEMEEIVRSETVVYPSWDRYIVRRMD